jgi:hypothetical protein
LSPQKTCLSFTRTGRPSCSRGSRGLRRYKRPRYTLSWLFGRGKGGGREEGKGGKGKRREETEGGVRREGKDWETVMLERKSRAEEVQEAKIHCLLALWKR